VRLIRATSRLIQQKFFCHWWVLFGCFVVSLFKETEMLKCKFLLDTTKAPCWAHATDVGYNLFSAVDIVVPARGQQLVDLGLAITVPIGTYSRITPRSSISLKNGIDVGASVVNAGYRDGVKVLLFNHSDSDFVVSVRDRIAQLILACIMTPEVKVVDELDNTDRGANRFGSTGIAKRL
jgi:dUTP pyrophosphatase